MHGRTQVSLAHFDRHHLTDAHCANGIAAVARSGIQRTPDEVFLPDLHYPRLLRGVLSTYDWGLFE